MLLDTLGPNSGAALAVGGLIVGIAFGWLVYATNFCIMGSLSDIYNLEDWRRFRAWILATVVAILAVTALHRSGLVPVERSMYLAPTLNWFGHIVGGAALGFGMVLTGGCPTRTLVRFGSGDLRSLVVLVGIGIAGFVMIGGVLAPARAMFEQATAIDLKRLGLETQSVAALLSFGNAARLSLSELAVAGIASIAGLVFAFSDRSFATSRKHVVSGIGVGLLVACGWALTGALYDEFAPRPLAPISLTFVRPLGDTLDWLQRYTAIPLPGFGVASVFGTALGAAGAALTTGRFRVLGFADVADLKTNLIGATLMGAGGAMALGCTIGQGVTGLSTLAIGSVITTAAIIGGGIAGLRYLERSLDA